MNEKLKNILKTFHNYGFNDGRMISGSKTIYHHTHPGNDILFNANIFTPSMGKVWHGDLDITLDCEKLQKVCDVLGEEMIVVSEMSGRFEAEDREYIEIIKDAHTYFTPKTNFYLKRIYDGLESKVLGNMTIVKSKGVSWEEVKY